ncbi:uncharacterized protein Hap1MRO34_017195 isoform 2-T2 [Clarias gariepinus]
MESNGLERTPEQATAPCAVSRRGDLQLHLLSYNGAVKPHAFIAQVELAADFAGWSPAETAVRVALSLEGEALRSLEDLRADERKDWAKLRESLHFRFGAGDRQEAACEELATRERRASEPLGAFAMDLRSLARRGYPEFGPVQQEELARRAFLRGIRPSRLREHIRLAAPSSLSEALREAEHAEPILAEHRGERAERFPVARGRSVGEPSRGQGYPSRLGLDSASELPGRQGPPDHRGNVPRPEDSVPQQPLQLAAGKPPPTAVSVSPTAGPNFRYLYAISKYPVFERS